MQRKEQDVNIRSPTFQQRIGRWPTSRRRRLPVDLPYYVMPWPDGCGGLGSSADASCRARRWVGIPLRFI